MFRQNCVKMLKLVCLYNTQRSSVFKSLTLGYSHILTRPSSSLPIFSKVQVKNIELTRCQSTNVKVEANQSPVPDGQKCKTPPALLSIAREAEALLGSERFSVNSSMSYNFGDFRDIVTLFLFKVAHIDHPLLHLAKIVEAEPSQSLSGQGENPYVLWRAMMVLLATEKFGYTKQLQEGSLEKLRIASDRLIRMAKIVEIAHATQQIHKRIVEVTEVAELASSDEQRKSIENLHKANKAAALIGDLLWTQKCVHMAALNCQPATGLICRFLMEYCESEFFFGVNGVKAEEFNRNAWVQKCQLGIGSLMGNSMRIMLLFSGYEDDDMRNKGFQLGSLMGMLHQAYEDIKYFEKNELLEPNWLDIGLLPVVFKIQSEPNLLKKSHREIFHDVKEDEKSMLRAKEMFYSLQDETLRYLAAMKPYESSAEAGDILHRFVKTLNV